MKKEKRHAMFMCVRDRAFVGWKIIVGWKFLLQYASVDFFCRSVLSDARSKMYVGT